MRISLGYIQKSRISGGMSCTLKIVLTHCDPSPLERLSAFASLPTRDGVRRLTFLPRLGAETSVVLFLCPSLVSSKNTTLISSGPLISFLQFRTLLFFSLDFKEVLCLPHIQKPSLGSIPCHLLFLRGSKQQCTTSYALTCHSSLSY